MTCKASNVRKICQSGMFHGEPAIKKVWRHVNEIWCSGICDVYLMQNRTDFIVKGYAILECFADLMRFWKKRFESAGFFHTTKGCYCKNP